MHTNAFTIDFEDWYQGIEIPIAQWQSYERRIEKGFYKVVELLARKNVKATFFTLGWIAEKYPHLVRELDAAGTSWVLTATRTKKCTTKPNRNSEKKYAEQKTLSRILLAKKLLHTALLFFLLLPGAYGH
jgi:hypothetical protein